MTVNERVSEIKRSQALACPVCGESMALQIARGRKSGKPFLMVKCLRDGRHFRGFVGDRDYVARLLEHLEQQKSANDVPFKG